MPEREGRGWPRTRPTVRQTCTTHKTATTVFNNVHESGAVLSPVQLKTGSSSEQNVDVLDKKLTDSLWAVPSSRDRGHKETRLTLEATQIKSEELINNVQNPRNTSSTQWRENSPTPSTRREKPVGRR